MAKTTGTDCYRPRYDPVDGPRLAAGEERKAMYKFQGNHGQDRSHLPRGGEFTYRHAPRPRISHRPLLTEARVSSPDPIFPGNDATEKFRQVDDLTESEEEDMVFSRSGDEGEQPPNKRLRTVPSWSNPDPYTALPPVTDTPRKKQDVVKLIRRSRVTTSGAQGTTAGAVYNEDFISLDMGDSTAKIFAEERNEPPIDAPTGPKIQSAEPPIQVGKRKRDAVDDVSKLPPRANRGARLHQSGQILREWRAADLESSTPWYRPPTTTDVLLGVALHQEVLDFYEWVRPQDFEQEIRLDVISRLQKTFSRLEPGCQLKPFGSFAAGLYLPTGDMDLVLMTFRSGRTKFDNNPKKLLWSIHSLLERERIAVPGSLQPIAKARVPIIKFVDALTGLKVDLSFNNDTGIVANDTFHQWKAQYPAMPILVSVIKQYLMIRGLNDVAFGGLGGFSIICLVTSLIQHHVRPGQIPNLGLLLLDFFYFYGTLFNKQDIAIRLEPPGFLRKDSYDPFLYTSERANRLAIIDPNKADNNISGGSAEIDLVFKCFWQAYNDVKSRMTKQEDSGGTSTSLLVDLLGGNYEAYGLQRERLRRIYSGRFSQNMQPLPSMVSLSVPPGVALPHIAAAGRNGSNLDRAPPNQPDGSKAVSGEDKFEPAEKLSKAQRRLRAAKERAAQLKRLRPDISGVGESLTVVEALKLGGYESVEKMDRDLSRRTRKMSL